MNVAVIGASNKPHRYSYQAVQLLKDNGHHVFPVHPRIQEIDGLPVYSSIDKIEEKLDTLTLYINADISSAMSENILSTKPQRIIFNPGAENDELAQKAKEQGIQTLKACTLVMLKTGQF